MLTLERMRSDVAWSSITPRDTGSTAPAHHSQESRAAPRSGIEQAVPPDWEHTVPRVAQLLPFEELCAVHMGSQGVAQELDLHASTGELCPGNHRIRGYSGRMSPDVGKLWSTLAESVSDLANIGPNSIQVAPNSVSIDRLWSGLDQSWLDFHRLGPEFDRIRPGFNQSWGDVGRLWPDVRQIQSGIGQIWSTSG